MTIDTHIGPATAIAVFGWHEQRLEGVGFVPVAPWDPDPGPDRRGAPALLSLAPTATVAMVDTQASTVAGGSRDSQSRVWLDALAQPPGRRHAAVRELHAYLLRVARFELVRRNGSLPSDSLPGTRSTTWSCRAPTTR